VEDTKKSLYGLDGYKDGRGGKVTMGAGGRKHRKRGGGKGTFFPGGRREQVGTR